MTALDALESQIDLYQYQQRALATKTALRQSGHDIPETLFEGLRYSNIVLKNAESIWVADWVVDTLEDAVNTFPEGYRVTPADMPMFNGFAKLERPVVLQTRPRYSVSVTSMAWYYDETRARIFLALFGTTQDHSDEWASYLPECKGVFPLPIGHVLGTDVPVGKFFEATRDGRIVPSTVDPEIAAAMWEAETLFVQRFAVSLWLFMRERRMVDLVTTNAPRALRRRIERDSLPMPTRVQTIVLRASERPSEAAFRSDGTHREYNVRWVVRGHWHRYWVKDEEIPTAKRLRPRWVSAYVKGPDGAELKNPIRLFAVTK